MLFLPAFSKILTFISFLQKTPFLTLNCTFKQSITMFKTIWHFAILVFSLLLSSCGNNRKLTTQTETLFRGKWRLTELQGQSLSDTARSTFEFSPGRITGSVGCNRLSADFVAGKNQTISFTPVSQTRMACPDEIAAMENKYIHSIGRSTNWEMRGGELWLGTVDSTLIKLRSF